MSKSDLHPAVFEFFSQCGKKGGVSRSDRKQVASRKNGKMGGRPKGSKNKVK